MSNNSANSVQSSQVSAVSSQTTAVSSQVSSLSSSVAAQSNAVATQSSAVAAAASANRRDVNALDAFIITPDDAARNPAAQPASGEQRLRIYVPNVKTCLAMGAPAAVGSAGGTREDDNGAPSYGGFDVGTDGNIFMTAQGSATFQSKSHVGIHSFGPESKDGAGDAGCVYIGGNNNVGIAAKTGNVIVNGGNGVTIAGGKAWGTFDQTAHGSEYSVEVPAWLAEGVQTGSDISKLWTVVDGACAALGLALGKWVFKVEATQSTASKIMAGINTVAAFANMGVNTASFFNKEPIGGLTLHGHTGLVAGTFGTMGLYSVAGTGIASVFGVQVLSPSTSIQGGFDATLVSNGGTAVLGKNVQLISENSTLLASRKGHIILDGQSVSIGSTSAVAAQQPADGVTIQSVNSVTIGSSGGAVSVKATTSAELSGTVDAALKGGIVTVGAATDAHMTGKTINISGSTDATVSGGKGLIKLTADEASIGYGKPSSDVEKQVSDLKKQIDENKTKIDEWSTKFNNARKKDRNQQAIRLEAASEKSKLQSANKELQKKLSPLTQDDNKITFKSGAIEITFKGNKIKMDDSKVESGPIKWMK